MVKDINEVTPLTLVLVMLLQLLMRPEIIEQSNEAAKNALFIHFLFPFRSSTGGRPESIMTSTNGSKSGSSKISFLVSPPKSASQMTPNQLVSPTAQLQQSQSILVRENMRKYASTYTLGEKFLPPASPPPQLQELEYGNVRSPSATGSPMITVTSPTAKFNKFEETLSKTQRVDWELLFKGFSQKLNYLETSVKNSQSSSSKVVGFVTSSVVASKNPELELALRVYDNDKKILDTAVANLKGFLIKTDQSIKNHLQGSAGIAGNRGKNKELIN